MKYLPVLLVLIGCAGNSGVIPMNSGTYMITTNSTELGYGPPNKTKAKVYNQANAFCANGIETVNLEISNAKFMKPGTVSLEFRCVNSN